MAPRGHVMNCSFNVEQQWSLLAGDFAPLSVAEQVFGKLSDTNTGFIRFSLSRHCFNDQWSSYRLTNISSQSKGERLQMYMLELICSVRQYITFRLCACAAPSARTQRHISLLSFFSPHSVFMLFVIWLLRRYHSLAQVNLHYSAKHVLTFFFHVFVPLSPKTCSWLRQLLAQMKGIKCPDSLSVGWDDSRSFCGNDWCVSPH